MVQTHAGDKIASTEYYLLDDDYFIQGVYRSAIVVGKVRTGTRRVYVPMRKAVKIEY